MSAYENSDVTISNPLPVPVTIPPQFATRSDTFTTTDVGTTVDASTFIARSYAIQVKGTGAPATSWTVQLEVSLDNVNFTSVMIHTNNVGDGMILLSGANFYPAAYFHVHVSSLVLGPATNIVTNIVGKG